MIRVTEKALKEIKRLQVTEAGTGQPSDVKLRVQVAGGGCSGMSYKLGFDKDPVKPNDKVFEQDGIQVVVDPKSYLYLNGIELDFSDGLQGTGFVFNNPNAKRTCGCGSSFSA
jgi:iron-sulfur cluster assembly protein